ncbi:MAG: hypothetical protein ACYDA8_23045 [Deferrisomatales bacterium]
MNPDRALPALILLALVAVEAVLGAARCHAEPPLAGLRPTAQFTPGVVRVHNQTSRSQAELDKALLAQVGADPYYEYKTYRNHELVEKIVAEGAYISEAALLNSVASDKHGKDYKSFLSLYLNGGFDESVFKGLACDQLKRAVSPEIRTTRGDAAYAHVSAEQVALFLSDKVDLTKCGAAMLNNVVAPENQDAINLNVARLLIESGAGTQGALGHAVSRLFAAYAVSNDRRAKEETDKAAVRSGVVRFLVGAGVKPTTKNLNDMVALYAKRIADAMYDGPRVTEIIQAQFMEMGRLFVDSGALANDETLRLFSEHKKRVARSRRSQELVNALLRGADEAVGLFERRAHVAQADLETYELTNLLAEAVAAGDKRRSLFYLNKGARGNLAILRRSVANRMQEVSEALLSQDVSFDPALLAGLALESGFPGFVDHLLDTNRLSGRGNESLVVEAAGRDQGDLAKKLVAAGADPEAAITLALKRYGSSRPSELVADAGGDGSRQLLDAFKAKEAAQKELERREQEAARAAWEKEEAERKRQELERYLKPKTVGERVCKDGNMAIFFSVTVTAFVEDVSGSRIRLRIVDTGGMTPRYNGVNLAANAVIWDDYQEWKGCGP